MEFTAGSSPICIDTRALACISNDCTDFLTIKEAQNISINGIGSGLDVAGINTLHWLLVNDTGTELDIHMHHAIYVPKCLMKLLCSQQLARQIRHIGDGFNALAKERILQIVG